MVDRFGVCLLLLSGYWIPSILKFLQVAVAGIYCILGLRTFAACFLDKKKVSTCNGYLCLIFCTNVFPA